MRSDRNSTLLAALALLGIVTSACGGDDGGGGGNPVGPGKTWTLTVSVASEQKQPVRNATVKILDGPDASKTATTDDSGTAVMYTVKEGSFSLEVTAQEYYRSTASVSLTTSTTVSVSMKERNKAPVLSSLVAQGRQVSQPPNMGDLAQPLDVTASVTDAETPVTSLAFAWTADMGTVSGTGPRVQWNAPSSGSTPMTATIGVTITEKFSAPGSTVVEENVTRGEVKVSVHDSVREAGSAARAFLLDFSVSSIPAATVISQHFSTSSRCTDGRYAELGDISDNRTNYNIISSNIGQPTTQIHYNSLSPFRARPGDAWVSIPCGWTSLGRNPAIPAEYGKTMTSSGICHLTAIYDTNRWAMCWSEWESSPTASGLQPTRFIR